jgi:hypothetical protein
VDHGAA